MITYSEALATVLAHAAPLAPARELDLSEALGYYVAEPVVAAEDLPYFDNAAMDGYAIQAGDVVGARDASPVRLRLVGVVPGGAYVRVKVAAGEAARVFTGGMFPAGADAVVIQEYCHEDDGIVTVTRPVQMGENVRRQGEEFRRGACVVTRNTLITPPTVGLLAAVGQRSVWVYPKPRVAVIVTGNELIAPGLPRTGAQIYDSNSFALTAALRALGVEPASVEVRADDEDVLKAALQAAFVEAEVVVTTGGISVGAFDLVAGVSSTLGVKTHFHKVAIKPGKPTYFGSLRDGGREKFLFGLPGNPVSALVTFHLFVKPALLKMMGAGDVTATYFPAVLEVPWRKKKGRREFVRGVLKADGNDITVRPTIAQESHMLGGLTVANCLVVFPEDADALSAGDIVTVQPLGWFE